MHSHRRHDVCQKQSPVPCWPENVLCCFDRKEEGLKKRRPKRVIPAPLLAGCLTRSPAWSNAALGLAPSPSGAPLLRMQSWPSAGLLGVVGGDTRLSPSVCSQAPRKTSGQLPPRRGQLCLLLGWTGGPSGDLSQRLEKLLCGTQGRESS